MKCKISLFLVVILVFLQPMNFAQQESTVISLAVYYDTNYENVEIKELKAIFGYVSADEFPGNATVYLLTSENKELYRGRFAFIEPIFVVSPPRADIDKNTAYGSSVIYPKDTVKIIYLPYTDAVSTVKIVLDTNKTSSKKEFVFNIKDRLCNMNLICEKEESVISCTDCKPQEIDGVCIYYADNVCDPDCLVGVDPDCIKKTPTPTIAIQETPIITPVVQRPSVETNLIVYLMVAAVIFLALLLLYFKKEIRGGTK